jgi:hypothetical protein
MGSNRITRLGAFAAAVSTVVMTAACTRPPTTPTPTPTPAPTMAPPAPTTAPPAPTTAPPGGVRWQSSDQWANWNDGPYTIYNNIWGSGAGSQSIWANSYRNWGVRANHPNTGGVKSYPNVSRSLNRRLSAIGQLRSSYSVTVPSSGAYATAYDIWADNHRYEIMIWMTKTGPVGPISRGRPEAVTAIGGHTWEVHRGSNGANEVFSFVRQSNANTGTVDIKAVLDWIRAQGWYGDVTIGEVQFGYEITSSVGNLAFTTNDYDLTVG